MRDCKDPRRCFLYRLTENRSLDGFKQLALISSTQDEYVPYESARIEKNELLLSSSDGVTYISHQYLEETSLERWWTTYWGRLDASKFPE